ncbi:MAG: M50 family metallopeptidase [Chloroflexota bacterium]
MQLLQFILGIAALIFLHELGHFLAARFFKVEVEEFGIGFPPRLVKLFEYNGTTYSLNWIPLGGFVRIKGENDPDVPGGLAAASPWVRLPILLAGPLTNLAVGVILATMLFYTLGDPIPEIVLVRYVNEESPAAAAGLQPGDQFLTVNSETISDMHQLIDLIDQNLDKPIQVSVLRGQEALTLTLTPRGQPPEGQGPMGVGLENPTRPISLLLAAQRGADMTYENIRGILLLPLRVLQGQVNPQESRLVGYKGMYDIYQEIQNPLYFFMVISISLGVMNLLPIPALDGGRILFTLPEIVIRRRIPAEYENVIHMVGFVLLLLLLFYINLQDFINPIQLP